MSALTASLLRAVLLAPLCVLAAQPLATCLRTGQARRVLLIATLAVVAMPGLVVAYGYSLESWSWAVSSWGRELLYDCLLLLRGACLVGLLLALLPPPPLEPEAVFLGRTARFGPVARLRLLLAGPWRNRLLAGLLVFVICFGEFTLSSRLSISRTAALGWAVELFDYHAVNGGDLAVTLRRALPALAIQLVPALVAIALLAGGRPASRIVEAPPRVRAWMGAGLLLVAALAMLVILPLQRIGAEGWRGLVPALGQAGILGPLGWSAFFAAAAGSCALLLTGVLAHRRWALGLLILPGLCGTMLIGLGLKAGVAASGLRGLADSPFPAVFGLTLRLAPMAVLVCLPVLLARDRIAWHSARMLTGFGRNRFVAWAWWHHRGGPVFWLWSLLVLLGIQDVLITDLLAPPGMQTAPALLYNCMHYQHSAILSARVLIFMLVPAVGLVILYATVRGLGALLLRWFWEPQAW